MTDNKLVTPDSTAFNDFITAVYAFFFVHKHLSFFGILPISLFACGTELLHTDAPYKLCAPMPDLIDKKEYDKIERKQRVWNERTKT